MTPSQCPKVSLDHSLSSAPSLLIIRILETKMESNGLTRARSPAGVDRHDFLIDYRVRSPKEQGWRSFARAGAPSPMVVTGLRWWMTRVLIRSISQQNYQLNSETPFSKITAADVSSTRLLTLTTTCSHTNVCQPIRLAQGEILRRPG